MAESQIHQVLVALKEEGRGREPSRANSTPSSLSHLLLENVPVCVCVCVFLARW